MRDTKQEILHFWFEETEPQQWFYKDPDFDALVRERFSVTCEMARDGLCDTWKSDEDGCLALIILLDQFPRHMFRNQPESFASDKKALLVAKHAISKGFDQIMNPVKRGFLYIPFQHSEELREQERSVELYASMKDVNPTGHDYAVRHWKVIKEYGRFPHRNKILGRENTPEEEGYLAQPGAGF